MGEIFGGGIAPSVAGYVAQHFAIERIFRIPIIGSAPSVVTMLVLRESAPRRRRGEAVHLGSR